MNVNHPKSYLCLLFCLFILILGCLEQAVNPLLEFQHNAIANGQWWRLLTGHLVHLGFVHTLLNLAGFILIMNLVGEQRSIGLWAISFGFIAFGISFLMLWRNPEIAYYAGLSGVLHGLLVFGLLAFCRSQKWLGAVGLGVVLIKVVYEQIVPNSTAQTAALIDAPVVSIAHFYGVCLGLALHLLLMSALFVKTLLATTVKVSTNNNK